jgi:hypothetical protein
MAYELQVHADVVGAQSLDMAASLVSRVATGSDALDASLRRVVGTNALLDKQTSQLAEITGLLRSQLALEASAAERAAGAHDQVTGSLARMSGGARTASNELRMLEGAMPIRAAGQFLSQIGLVNATMAAAFPIFGLVAVAGVLDTVAGKLGLQINIWKQIDDAQKESTQELERQADAYNRLMTQLRDLQDQEYRRAHGEAAGVVNEGQRSAISNEQQIQILRQELAALRSVTNPKNSTLPTQSEAFYASMAGMKIEPGVYPSYIQQQAGAARIPAVEAQLRTAEAQREADQAAQNSQLNDIADKNRRDAIKQAEEAARKTAEADRKLAAGLDHLAEVRKSLADIGDRNPLLELLARQAADVATHPEIAGQLRGLYSAAIPAAATETAKKSAQPVLKAMEEERDRQNHAVIAGLKDESKGLTQQQDDVKRQLEEMDRQARMEAEGQVRMAQRQGRDAIRNARGGSPYAVEQAADYEADLVAAAKLQQVKLGIVTLDQVLGEREEKRYQAQIAREDALAELQAKDLEHYQELAGSVFDAIKGHSTNQWARSFVTGQEKTIFENLAGGAFKHIGESLGLAGDLSGISKLPKPFGGMLSGTVLDPANRAVVSTDNNTVATDRNTAALVATARGLGLSPSAGVPGAIGLPGGAGSGLSGGMLSGFDIYNLPTSGNPLTQFDIPGMGGSTAFGVPEITDADIAAGMSNPASWGRSQPGMSAGQIAGYGTAALMAGYGIYSGLSEGGVGGDAQALASGLAGASAIPGPQAPFLMAAAALTSMVGAILGQNPQHRAAQINEMLASNQYLGNTPLNVTQGMNGTYEDFDARGNLRTSSMSAIPTVLEPYITSRVVNGQRTYYNAPGTVTAPYSGGPSGSGQAPVAGGLTINMSAIDMQSGFDFIMKNHPAVGAALLQHLQSNGGERLADAIRYHANP